MKQPIFAGDSIAMRVIYHYIDQNNLNITFEETAGGVVEPHQIKIISKEYFTAIAPEWNGKVNLCGRSKGHSLPLPVRTSPSMSSEQSQLTFPMVI